MPTAGGLSDRTVEAAGRVRGEARQAGAAGGGPHTRRARAGEPAGAALARAAATDRPVGWLVVVVGAWRRARMIFLA